MVNYNFNLKHPNSEDETPINLIIRWDKRRLMYSTFEKVLPKHFEVDKTKKNFQRIKSSFVEHTEFNLRLNHIEAVSRSTFRQFVNDNNRYPEPNELKKLLDIRLRFVQEEKMLTLFQFIESFIKEVDNDRINRDTGKKLAKVTIASYRNVLEKLREFEKWRKTFYHKGKKIVPENIAKIITNPIALAVWFMGDGTLDYRVHSHYSFTLSTDAFTVAEVRLLQNTLLQNFGIESSIQTPSSRGTKYTKLYIGKNGREKFLETIKPYMLNCFAYKIPPQLHLTPQRLNLRPLMAD